MIAGVLWLALLGNAQAEPSVEEGTMDCAQAPERLGYPGATVVRCGPFYGSPRLWFVWLSTSGGAVKRLVLPGPDGLFQGTGLAAAGRFLEEGRLDQNRQLDELGAMLLVSVADARPPGWTALDGAGDFPVGLGQEFRAAPFQLTLRRQVRPSLPGTLLSGAGYGQVPGAYEQAVLARSGPTGGWEWTLSTWVEETWVESLRVPLR